MTKEEVFKKYANKPMNIEGRNLFNTEGVTFSHLVDDGLGLEYQLERLQLEDRLKQEFPTWDARMTAEYKAKMDKGYAELNERDERGELALTPENKKNLQFLEKLYFGCLETKVSTKPLKIENGKVLVPKIQTHHDCDIDTLSQFESYADLGIVATEWFNIYEQEGEARFCAFVKHDSIKPLKGFKVGYNVRFYIDDTNQLWKMLSWLDFFEYEHIKQTEPEKIKERYPKEIIDLYDQIIEPLSRRGKNMHSDPLMNTMTWQAIPGGIPPQLIVGIEINSKMEQLVNQAHEIQKMFPNAVVFDETKKVLAAPKRQQTSEQSF